MPGRSGRKVKVFPMRYLRMLFVVLLAVILIGVALANRQLVTVSLFPDRVDGFIAGEWSAQMPLFLVIIMSLLVGMILGLIWEWMRESVLRRESAQRAHELQVLEREVGQVRKAHHAPRDEVLAILDAPKAKAGAAPAVVTTRTAAAPALPARR